MPRKPISEREELSWGKQEITKKLAEKSKIKGRADAFNFTRMLHIALVHDTLLPEDSKQRIFKANELTNGDYKDKDFQCQMIVDSKETICKFKQVKGLELADVMNDVLVEVTCVTKRYGKFKVRNKFKNLSGQLDGLKKLDKKWWESVKVSKNTQYDEPVVTNPEEVENVIQDRIIPKSKLATAGSYCSVGAAYGGKIPDSSFTASSAYDGYHSARNGRINRPDSTRVGGNWAPTSDRPIPHSLHEIISLLNKAIAGLDGTAIARKQLENAFIDAAKFYYRNKPTNKRDRGEEPELTDSDFQFLYPSAIKACDYLLAWRDLYQMEPPKDGLQSCGGKKCKFCPIYKTKCRRKGDKMEYKTAVKTSDGPPCKVKRVIYMFFCSKCDRRYVGKTEDSVAERYPKGPDSVLDGKKKTRSKACTSGEHDLQWTIPEVVDESSLTLYNPIFNDCLKTLGPDFKLEGVEQLWIQKLATNPNTDFNTIRSHDYAKRKGGKELLKLIGAKAV